MTTEKLIVKTKDDHIRVLDITFSNAAERARLKHQCEVLVGGLNLSEGFRLPAGVASDEANTTFLNEEISGYHYRKDRARFSNGLRSDPPARPNTLYISHQMSDDDFPEMIKNLGFEINPKDREYTVHYNPAKNEFETTPEFLRTNASVNASERRMDIVRNSFRFSPDDYQLLEDLKQQFARAKQTHRHLNEADFAASLTDSKESALFYFYANEVYRNRYRPTTIGHELKHIANAVFFDGLALKKDSKRLQTEDYYRIAVEDERSAYLSELVNNINTYLQNGDYNDFSMFSSNNQEHVTALKRLRTPEERKAYAQNWPELIATKMKYFEREHRKFYDSSQLPTIFNEYINEAPLAAPEDADRSEFKKLRSLYYNYQIYNPETHRMEHVNLSRYITPDLEVLINDDKRNRIINPVKAQMTSRLQHFDEQRQNGSIDAGLVEPAKRMLRENLRSSGFVTEIENFRIASLYGPEENAPEPSTPTPTPTPPTPDDRAQWSDDLQRYWRQVDGYSEVAKNNNEYKFKINDATVRYTNKKQVEVSSNADYALYDKLLKEPSNRAAPVEFLDTLSKEQKLLLYIACVNNGRRMSGNVPTDLSGIDRLRGIPEAEMTRFRSLQASRGSDIPSENHQPASQRQPTPQQRQMSPALRQAAMSRRLQKR